MAVSSFLLFIFIFYVSDIAAQQNPLFQRVAAKDDRQVYDTRAWSYYTGAPVRATILVSGDMIYAGNASGDFLAINKKDQRLKWSYHTGSPIHSSALEVNNRLFFSDNRQTVYALDKSMGKLIWKFSMSPKQDYPWRYDYYYSSPVLHDNKLLIGGEDGYFYALNLQSGQVIWKFKCKGIVRSSAAIFRQSIVFGDTEATLYSLNDKNGSLQWEYKINGDTMRNESYGFDRRAITSSPVVAGNKIISGARDGYLYCISATDGKPIWKVDHRVSWVISTVAVKDSFVVTGTSDGRFVQAVNLETGREIWKYRTGLAVWASPLIVGNHVYAGGFDGQFTCLDLSSGRRISQLKTNGKILSSPVWNDGMIYFGCDDGNIYAISGHEDRRWYATEPQRYVYYEPGYNMYFRSNSDLVVRNYMRTNGYKVIGTDSLAYFLSTTPPQSSIFVFAATYFPPAIIEKKENSILRTYLNAGGRIVLPGLNPLIYTIDEKSKQPVDYGHHAADTVLSLLYGAGDTRSFMGDFTSFPTVTGRQLGLPDFWNASLFISEKNIDIVLGKNENGDVSAFVKKYSNNGQLVQIWIDPDQPDKLDAIIKAGEWRF